MEWVHSTFRREDRQMPRVGAQIKVDYRIREGTRERIQTFEGVVIRCHRGASNLNATFTVRKISQGFGVERIFPLHSPLMENIKTMRRGAVRRSKLYYLRNLRGKKARLREINA